jgi:hypothetical protein
LLGISSRSLPFSAQCWYRVVVLQAPSIVGCNTPNQTLHPTRYDRLQTASLSGEDAEQFVPETCPRPFLHICLCFKTSRGRVDLPVSPDRDPVFVPISTGCQVSDFLRGSHHSLVSSGRLSRALEKSAVPLQYMRCLAHPSRSHTSLVSPTSSPIRSGTGGC